MNRKVLVFALVAVILVSSVVAVLVTSGMFSVKNEEFYFGVTYGGNNVHDAKLLIDKVKGYTNTFVLASGPLLLNATAIDEIGDYAVNAGLHVILYFGVDSAWSMQNWLKLYNGNWGANFLGAYIGDEPGGKMLDSNFNFNDTNLGWCNKNSDGSQQWEISNGTGFSSNVICQGDGTILYSTARTEPPNAPNPDEIWTTLTYYANGTTINATRHAFVIPANASNIIFIPSENSSLGLLPAHTPFPSYEQQETTTIVTDNSTLPYTYRELWDMRPIKNSADAAEKFVANTAAPLEQFKPLNSSCFTADYGLYWYDYLAGYHTVFAELGWNISTSQNIDLVRGAANLQNKSWGTIITWKYMQEPYLASGTEIYDQMKSSYECGAKYVLVFNYADNMTGPYGTLKEDHFQALRRFWNDVVKNPSEHEGSIIAHTAFLLPHNFGGGLRKSDDTVWGLWQPSIEYQQVYANLQKALATNGEKIDVVYEDPAYPVSGHYSTIIYWNQTI